MTTVTREATVVRLDLQAPSRGPEAFVIAYTYRKTTVVIRAEASRVPGEAKPSLALVSDERAQPAEVVMPVVAMRRRKRPMRPDIDVVGF